MTILAAPGSRPTIRDLKDLLRRQQWTLPQEKDIGIVLKYCEERHPVTNEEYVVDHSLHETFLIKLQSDIPSGRKLSELFQLLFYISGNERRHKDLVYSVRLK